MRPTSPEGITSATVSAWAICPRKPSACCSPMMPTRYSLSPGERAICGLRGKASPPSSYPRSGTSARQRQPYPAPCIMNKTHPSSHLYAHRRDVHFLLTKTLPPTVPGASSFRLALPPNKVGAWQERPWLLSGQDWPYSMVIGTSSARLALLNGDFGSCSMMVGHPPNKVDT